VELLHQRLLKCQSTRKVTTSVDERSTALSTLVMWTCLVSGKLTFKEFLQVVRNKVEERDNLDGLRKGFDSMDFNGKKVLTLSELKTAANLLREPLDREEGQVRGTGDGSNSTELIFG